MPGALTRRRPIVAGAAICLVLVVGPATGGSVASGQAHIGSAAVGEFFDAPISGAVHAFDSLTSGPFACAAVVSAVGLDEGCGPATIAVDPMLTQGHASGTIASRMRTWQGAEVASTISFEISWTEDFLVVLPGAAAGIGLSPWIYAGLVRPAVASAATFGSQALGTVDTSAGRAAQLHHAVWVSVDT